MTNDTALSLKRRRLLMALGSSAVASGLAGCSGGSEGGSNDEPTTTQNPATTEMPGDELGSTATATERAGAETETKTSRAESKNPETETTMEAEDSTAETENPQTESPGTESGNEAGSDYRFSAGESYTFDVVRGESAGSASWTVTEVDGDRVTVELRSEFDGEFRSETVTGTHTGIYNLQEIQPGGLTFPIARTARLLVGNHSLEPGEEWTTTLAGPAFDREDGDSTPTPVTVEVTGTATHAGIECSTIEVRFDSVIVIEGCVNKDYPFALRTVFYDESKSEGTVFLESTLIDYSENGGGLTTTGSATGADETAGTNNETAGESGATGSERAVCPSLTDAERARYDEPESPFIATFEHPGSVAATATVNDNHGLTIQIDVGDRQYFNLLPGQDLQGSASPTPAMKGEIEGLETYSELEYAGETLPLVRAAGTVSGGGNADDETRFYVKYPYYLVGLPYEGSEGKKYYRFQVQATVETTDSLEAPVCLDSYEMVAKSILSSLEPNPDSTVESAGVDG